MESRPGRVWQGAGGCLEAKIVADCAPAGVTAPSWLAGRQPGRSKAWQQALAKSSRHTPAPLIAHIVVVLANPGNRGNEDDEGNPASNVTREVVAAVAAVVCAPRYL